MKKESLEAARAAYEIEYQCIKGMLDYFNEEAFSEAVELLKNAERIGTSGCGHSGIICQHFTHLLNCIEQPAKFISPAEAVHGGTGFLREGDVMVLQGAGISNGQDVYNTIKLGAQATGSTSGILKAADPYAMVEEMIYNLRKAWNELHP